MKIELPAAAFRDFGNSKTIEFRIEPALNCQGEDCNRWFADENGDLETLPPHFHLLLIGHNPEAGPRCWAIDGELPKVDDSADTTAEEL